MLEENKFNLQLFAGEQEEKEDKQDNQQEDKTYTQAELDDMLQKETDRRVSEAIKKREEKLREELDQVIETKLKNAERLSKLSAEEKEKEILEQAKKDIAEREKAIERKELLSDTKDRLYDEKIPVKFADILVKEDAETTNESIKTFKTEWQNAIDEAVTERLRGKTPTKSSSATNNANPFEKGANFNLTAQAEIYRENPAEADRLRQIAKNKN